MCQAPGSYLSHGAARVRFLSLHAPSGPTLARALHPLDESQGLSSLVLVRPLGDIAFLCLKCFTKAWFKMCENHALVNQRVQERFSRSLLSTFGAMIP